MTTPELFHVSSTIMEFHGCKDVCIAWFNTADARPDLPFAALIEGYDEMDTYFRRYSEGYVSELFTAEQARALVTYLDQHHGHESVQATTRVKLPVPGNIMGCGAIPVGGPQDFYLLCKEEEWTLPFEVWGYYDLRQHEPVAEHEAAPHPTTNVAPPGFLDTNAANDNTVMGNIKPTKPVDHCMHFAGRRLHFTMGCTLKHGGVGTSEWPSNLPTAQHCSGAMRASPRADARGRELEAAEMPAPINEQ